ncbi:hypothetical protein PVAP13_9NG516400 [Panicum virgatum]|uniref:Uncharacterized protein n=1 Tax=Panicum virgatum TaxID=38727 RepID=A0A8T0MYB4_PANVG|nr:hypothetical protein PVAP13_9NG516400 [Panicum virgatum]
MELVVKRHHCTHSANCVCLKGHISEDAMYVVFKHMNWNPKMIAIFSGVCKWFDEFAKKVLWKEFCQATAPKMMNDLHSDGSHIVDGNWKALGKLLIYCSGNIHVPIPGHFVYRTRFSRTLGKSLLTPQCRMLIERQAMFHPNEVCIYCKTKLWHLMQPNMIPSSASMRLDADDDSVEYYVCLNGHIIGSCTLMPFSDSEDTKEE